MEEDTDQPDTRFLVENLARSAQGLSVIFKEDKRTKLILRQYMHYLFSEKPRNYMDLSAFLAWWGEKYVLPDIEDVLLTRRYENITELGPGTGWLIKAMTKYGKNLFAIDKRWTLIEKSPAFHFAIQDMEKFPRVSEVQGPENLIIANQFLHCVENPDEILQNNRSDWLVVEVGSLTWRDQMREFGAQPISPKQVEDLFVRNGFKALSRKRSTVVHVSLWRPV